VSTSDAAMAAAVRSAPANADRELPHDLGAERVVLGALLTGATIRGLGGLAADAFYRPAHQLIYEAIEWLTAEGRPYDSVAVLDELRHRRQLNRMGGGPYLHTCVEQVPSLAQAGYYAEIVRGHSERRRVAEAANRIQAVALDPSQDLTVVRDLAAGLGSGQQADWDEPVPLGSRAPSGSFPVEALPDWLSSAVTATAGETQTPADIPGTLALGSLSAAAGGKVVVHVRDGWTEPVNLYLAAIAEPGTRKSAVYQAMTQPLIAAERALDDHLAQARYEAQVERARLEDEAKDARTAAIRAKGTDIPQAVEDAAQAARRLEEHRCIAPVQLVTGDISPEECTTILAAQGGRLAIMSAEGRIFDIITGRYSNGDPCLSPFLEGHAGDPLRVNRRDRYEDVPRPALTIAVAIQPAVLTEVMSKPRLRGQGMLARFLYSLPADHVGYRESDPAPAPSDIMERYAQNLQSLVLSLAELEEPLRLTLEPAALKLLIAYMDEIEPRLRADGDLYAIRDWAAKLAGAAVRMSGLLHVAANLRSGFAQPITEPLMGQAISLATYFAEHAAAAFGLISAHPSMRLAMAILDWAENRDGVQFTQRDAHRKFESRVRAVSDVAAALALLEEHGYIRPADLSADPPRKGRPRSPAYVLIPMEAGKIDRTRKTAGELRK
jgi:replicative DNA helicase